MLRLIFYITVAVVSMLFNYSNSRSQSFDKQIFEIERDRHLNSFNKYLTEYRSDTNINATYYKLDLYITYEPNFLTGAVTINSTSRINNLTNLFYDFSDNMTVDSILYNQDLLAFIHTQNKIFITLNNSFSAGQNISLKIFYHGVPVPTGFGSFIFGSHGNNEPSIWTLSEPYGCIDWYPCKNTPSDKVDSSDVWLRCSDQLTAVSNGLPRGIENNGDGTLTYKWHNSYPIANYLISLAISNYAQYNFYFKYSVSDSMPVVNFIYPENLEALKPQLDKTDEMLELFSNTYGPYPFLNEKYGHAEFGRNAGMENQTISSMGAFNDDIIAHELTHQWFGDKITCRNWENIWLNEGFATYGQAIFHEAAEGKSGYNNFIKNTMANAKTAVGTIYVEDVNNINEIFSGNRSYAKGCTVLHMLRGVTGDSVFFRILRTYVADTAVAYKTAITDNFKNVAENVSGMDLNYFFNEWIYGENYPQYDVSWTTESINSNQYKASIKIQQNVNNNPAYFTMPLQIQISMQSGDTLFTVFNDRQTQTFDFILNSNPLNFKIDPDNWILKAVRGEGIVPVSYSLNQNFPNPFNPATTITYRLGRPSSVTITVYDLLGQQLGVLVNEKQREGYYAVEFTGNDLPSGAYFYTLQAYDYDNIDLYFEEARKMILVK